MNQVVAIIESDRKKLSEITKLITLHFPGAQICNEDSVTRVLEICKGKNPDLILISDKLYEKSSNELIKKINYQIPVIILTETPSDIEDFKKAISGEATTYVQNPNNETGFINLVRVLLQNSELKKENQYRTQLYNLFSKLGSKFINISPAEVDAALNESMSEIGKFTEVDRVYLFDYDFEKNITTNTHEWCAPGISHEIDNLQALSLTLITEWIEKHKRGETVFVPSVKSLDPDDEHRKMLEPQSIQSIFTIPLFYEKECFGFVGFDSCKYERKWKDDEISVLQLFADLLTNLKIKKKFTSKIFQVESIYKFIANNINDAVALVDLNGDFIFISPSHKNVTGRGEEIIGKNIFQFVHPDDRKKVGYNVLRARNSDNEYIVEYRYLHPEQGYLWFEALGKRHIDNDGNIFGLFASRNIHARKQSEQALEETRQILHSIINTIPVRVFWKDKNLKYLGCNLPFALDSGFKSPKDVIGKDDYQMPWQEFAERYRTDDKSVIDSGASKIGFEEPISAPDRNLLWVRTSKVPLTDSNGSIIGVLGTYEDISQKKLLEDTLRESELRYRTLIETSQDGISLIDLQGNILYANRQKARMMGVNSPQELIGTNAIELLHPDDRTLGREKLVEILEKRTITNIELKVERKNNTFFFASINISLVKDEKGLPIHIIIFMQDITERIETQNALRTEKDFAEQLMKNMGEGLTVINKTGILEYVNPAYAKMLGLKTNEIIGRKTEDFTSPDDHYILKNVLSERLKGKKSSYEIRLLDNKGHEVPVWITGVPRWQNKTVIGAIAVITDISERVKAQEALKESELRFQLLAEVAPVGIFRTDAQGVTNYVNPRWCEISQLSMEEAIGDGWLKAVHPDDRKKIAKTWEKATAKKESSETEYRFLHADNSVAWVMGRAVPQKNKRGIIIGYIGTITDITERKLNEAILYEREERYRLLFENNPAPMLIYEKGPLKILAVNEAFEQHYGYSRKEAYKLLLTDLYPTEEKEAVTKLVNSLKGHSKSKEWHHLKKDGTQITIIASSHELIYMGKKARVAVFTDISQRKLIEEALRESEERFRRLAENADDVIYRFEIFPERKFTYVSPAIYKVMGYTPEECYADPDLGYKIVHPDDRSMLENISVIEVEFRKPVVLRWLKKDGNIIWTEQKNVPIYDNNGTMIAVEGIARDITQRKQQEEEIKKLSVGIEQSPVSVIITDTDGTIEYVNRKFCDITGYQPEEVLGKNPSILKSGNKTNEEYDALWQTIISGKEWRGEFLNKKKNGDLYWESASISPIRNEKGENTLFIGVKEDITARKGMEAELMAAKEKAEESDRLKTAFLNNMSHEIRTPLNAITGFSELLNSKDNDPEEITQYTSVIKQSSNQLLSIIDDIVNIATIEAGQVKLLHKNTNVNQILQNVYEQIKIKVSEINISCEIEQTLPDTKANIITDETKLTQILSNLVTNALKFTEKGSIKYGCFLKDKYILFYVKDTGIGIPENLHKKIFERFRQSDSSVSRKYGGTGLGLSISKSFVELLGGEIWFESETGKGSTFYFSIPWVPFEDPKNQNFSKGEIYLEKHSTILLAEDEDYNYLLVEKILEGQGLTFLRAVNGKIAVELCNKHPEIDLVLMDIKMPVMNGFEAARLIKAARPDLPVIVLTAYVQPGAKEEVVAKYYDDYLSKPFSREDLLLLLKKHLNKQVL